VGENMLLFLKKIIPGSLLLTTLLVISFTGRALGQFPLQGKSLNYVNLPAEEKLNAVLAMGLSLIGLGVLTFVILSVRLNKKKRPRKNANKDHPDGHYQALKKAMLNTGQNEFTNIKNTSEQIKIAFDEAIGELDVAEQSTKNKLNSKTN
jgi:hypothetical protein